jgi:hypothetical protein
MRMRSASCRCRAPSPPGKRRYQWRYVNGDKQRVGGGFGRLSRLRQAAGGVYLCRLSRFRRRLPQRRRPARRRPPRPSPRWRASSLPGCRMRARARWRCPTGSAEHPPCRRPRRRGRRGAASGGRRTGQALRRLQGPRRTARSDAGRRRHRQHRRAGQQRQGLSIAGRADAGRVQPHDHLRAERSNCSSTRARNRSRPATCRPACWASRCCCSRPAPSR